MQDAAKISPLLNGLTSTGEVSSSDSLVELYDYSGRVKVLKEGDEWFFVWAKYKLTPGMPSYEKLCEYEATNRYDLMGTYVYALIHARSELKVMGGSEDLEKAIDEVEKSLVAE